jgi:hypothetical protein
MGNFWRAGLKKFEEALFQSGRRRRRDQDLSEEWMKELTTKMKMEKSQPVSLAI